MKTPQEWREIARQQTAEKMLTTDFIEAIQKDALSDPWAKIEEAKSLGGIPPVFLERRPKTKPEEIFQYVELHYKTEDVSTLKTILECNNQRISAALSIAIDELFLDIPEQLRAVFIVEKCEDILSGKINPQEVNLKQFTFTRRPTS